MMKRSGFWGEKERNGWCCMPGYGRERMKLKEYLGIEWVEHGLDISGQSDSKTIYRSTDLDCTFSDPSKCRWRNVRESEGLDSLDFHLFEKTDYTEFPIIQVRPGPSKLVPGNTGISEMFIRCLGDRLIFTGDRKDEEQTSILLSSPIGCQNSTGQLAFTFWLYNGAGVEVVILEKQDGKIVVLPEKPYVDCGPVHLNTECVAEIPPRDTPFYLGISAFGINTKEGSFAMIDNILYNASLCKVAIDLGDNFKGRPFITQAVQPPIETPSQLNCKNFDENCRWKSTGHAKEMWQVADEAPPKELLFQATGTLLAPVEPFLYMYLEQGHIGEFNALQSDVITCQSQSDSKFSFRFWASPGVKLEVCATDINLRDLECFMVPMLRSPAIVSFSFRRATSQFTITIKVKSVNTDADSFIAVDDLTYSAIFCSDAMNSWDLGNNFFVTRMLSALLHRPVHTDRSLGCSFLHRGVNCLWGNEEGARPMWMISSAPLNYHKFFSLTHTSEMPNGEFGVVQMNRDETANLITEPIRCLNGEGVLSFRFWQTGGARLSVCLLENKLPELIDCQKVAIPQPGPAIIEIPQMKQSFRIAFRAEASNKGMIMLDDINFQGNVCAPVKRVHGIRTTAFTTGTVQLPDPNVCYLLSCNFQEGQSCLYKSGNIGGSQGRFRTYDGFTVANLFLKGRIAVLESPPFNLNVAARVYFSYKKEKDGSLLFICQDSATKELENCYEVGRNGTKGTWVKDYMELLPSDIKFYFVAKLPEGSRRARVSIAEIFLTDIENNTVCT